MKKLYVCVVLLILAVALCGCAATTTVEAPASESRFVVVEQTNIWKVVYDKETCVMYAVSYGRYNLGTFTPLYDNDGSPLLWKCIKE